MPSAVEIRKKMAGPAEKMKVLDAARVTKHKWRIDSTNYLNVEQKGIDNIHNSNTACVTIQSCGISDRD